MTDNPEYPTIPNFPSEDQSTLLYDMARGKDFDDERLERIKEKSAVKETKEALGVIKKRYETTIANDPDPGPQVNTYILALAYIFADDTTDTKQSGKRFNILMATIKEQKRIGTEMLGDKLF